MPRKTLLEAFEGRNRADGLHASAKELDKEVGASTHSLLTEPLGVYPTHPRPSGRNRVLPKPAKCRTIFDH